MCERCLGFIALTYNYIFISSFLFSPPQPSIVLCFVLEVDLDKVSQRVVHIGKR